MDSDMTTSQLKGVIAAVPTPVDGDGIPIIEAFLDHGRWVLDNGGDGLNVLGSTGEANSLSVRHRRAVMKAAAENLPAERLMVGTGTPDLETTVELTRFAHGAGFAVALVLPPYYYKPVSEDGLFAWFERLLHHTRDVPVPVYLYNYPQMTGITFSRSLAERLFLHSGGRIAGMKDSSGDLDYAADMATIEGFDVFPSNEVALARCEADGYAGCISATVNVDPASSAALYRDNGDAAVLERVRHIRQTVASFPLVPAVKYLAARRMGDESLAHPLPPFLPLTRAQQDTIVAQLEG
jgi:4-hydroxy-tetrahydrodipicolinate synthase